ncbi:uncharacterized protein LOC131011795 [Salvia miltiorrhiza]|uniref:uncharacterized protein LOC131011795 n=1 Tax=Salvia miltiorrhiza TaxID=226208 RepID=UPI0025ACF69E|nr:uncharacterized protein LOC131011795 [Salvia miltiorrhiza]
MYHPSASSPTQRNRYGELQFAPIHHHEAMESDDSGAISPPLWRSSPSPSRPLLSHRASFSPDSRAQAIARGRSELMEMVRHMPESSYELSLKDIVEHHHRAENQINQSHKTGGLDSDQRAAAGLKKEEGRKFDRKLSFEDKGFFLNMAFPFSFKSKKKKKNVGGNSGRVSPKPDGLKGGGEKDWWKKKFTGSSDSDSSRISNNSGSSSAATATTTTSGRSDDARGRRRNGGCWQLFQLRRSKSA